MKTIFTLIGRVLGADYGLFPAGIAEHRIVGFNDSNLKLMAEAKSLAPAATIFWGRTWGYHSPLAPRPSATQTQDDITVALEHGFDYLVLHKDGCDAGKVAGSQSHRSTHNNAAMPQR